LQSDVKADISIYFEQFDGRKRYGMYGSGMEPQPGKTSWVRLEKEENWKLRRSSKPTGQQGRDMFHLLHVLINVFISFPQMLKINQKS